METLTERKPATQTQAAKTNCELDAVHAIKKINYHIRSKEVAGSFALALLELGCYLSSLALVVLVVYISGNILTATQQLSTQGIAQRENIQKLIHLLSLERFLLIALCTVPLFFGMALRKLRKKNNALGYAKTKAKDFLERHNLT